MKADTGKLGENWTLNHVGMTTGKPKTSKSPKPPVLCSRSYWVLSERGGMIQVLPRAAEYIRKGQPIATQVNIFGDAMHEYTAPQDGIVIGHAVNPVGQTGERILHLGQLMSSEEKLDFERISGCSLGGVADERPGEQDVPSVKPV